MKTVNIRLSEYQAQIVLKLLDHVIDGINAGDDHSHADPLGIGIDNYIDVANEFEEVLEEEYN